MEFENASNSLKNIKSDFILKKIFSHVNKYKIIKLFNHNKNLQKRLKLNF